MIRLIIIKYLSNKLIHILFDNHMHYSLSYSCISISASLTLFLFILDYFLILRRHWCVRSDFEINPIEQIEDTEYYIE